MYQLGDYVMYGKDVCKVYEINEKRFNNEDYYLLRPVKDESLKIEVPVSNKNGKIRNLISSLEAEEIISKIPMIPVIDTDEKFIENEYKNLLQDATHEDLIRIIKTSYLRNQNRLKDKKKLSEKDTKYFELAEEYLYHEFSIVLGFSYEDTKKYIVDKVHSLESNA